METNDDDGFMNRMRAHGDFPLPAGFAAETVRCAERRRKSRGRSRMMLVGGLACVMAVLASSWSGDTATLKQQQERMGQWRSYYVQQQLILTAL